MKFWQHLRLLGSILVLAVAALTICAAFMLEPQATHPTPSHNRTGPSTWPLGSPATTGL
jgi:hypothetical protein